MYVEDYVEVKSKLIIALFCTQGHSMFKAVLKMNRDGGKGNKKDTGTSRQCEIDGGFLGIGVIRFLYPILMQYFVGGCLKMWFGNIHMNKNA